MLMGDLVPSLVVISAFSCIQFLSWPLCHREMTKDVLAALVLGEEKLVLYLQS